MLCFPKLISSFPSANPLPPEHKIGVFVRFLPPKPSFSGISSTKSRFLCAFWLRNPHFRAFRAQNRGSCALLAFETLVFGLFEHKIEVFVLGGAFVFWVWWVLSCILTFVVCLSNFYELFLLKLPLRVCWSVLTGALLPERTCRSVAAVKWLPLSRYRGAAAGMLSPPPECYCHHRRNAATAAGGDLVALSLL